MIHTSSVIKSVLKFSFIGVVLVVTGFYYRTVSQTKPLSSAIPISSVYACGGGCRSFCGSYNYCSACGPGGCYSKSCGCSSTVQVCDPACPPAAPPPPPPPPPPPSGGGQCSGYCGGCVSSCYVSASNCSSLLAANCYQNAGVTRVVTSVATGAQAPVGVSVGQTSVRTTTGGGFVPTGSGVISNGYIVNTLGKCTIGTTGCSATGTISTLNCTGAICTIPNIAGLKAVVYYCPGGLTAGVCLQGLIPITVTAGQKVDFSQYIQNGCGAIQVDFDTSSPAGTGNAGAATIDSGKTCGAAPKAATAAAPPPPGSNPPPPPTAGQCTRIKVYKGTTAVDPKTLQVGDNVTLAVAGTNATKGRIRVNGAAFVESTTLNANGEYTVPFTIPSGVPSYTIEAEVFTNGTWQ